MKKLLSMFVLSYAVIQPSDPVVIAGGGASSGVSQEPHRKKVITSPRKVFDMNEPVGVAGGGASSGVSERIHDQESIVSFSQLSPKQEAMLKTYRTTNLVIAIDYTEMNRKEKAIGSTILESILTNQLFLCTKSVFLSMRKGNEGLFKDFLQGYICKEVNDDYVLFVPEAMQHNDQPVHVQNALVGLNFSELPDYDHTVSNEAEFDQIKAKSSSVAFGDSGKILLETLQKLKITDISPELLPHFNFFLNGHGEPGVIADISAKSQEANKPSDFLKVMQFFDKSFKTKSVGLFSCYLGGKQNIDTYSMHDQEGRPVFNKYNNALLENLSYSIINFGSLHQYLFSKTNIAQYFGWMNEDVPAYEKILNQVRHWAIDNWVSIKLPHTSWFSPVELKNKTQTLSQVAMSTRKTVVDIRPETEVIILQANYIPQLVVIHGNKKLSFLPVNYHDQSYYFKSLRITGQANSTIIEALNSLIFNNVRVREEISFAFEELQINNVVYKNVHCFVSKFDNVQGARTGFIYEDPQGRVFEYSWPAQMPSDMSGGKTVDMKIENYLVVEKSLPRETWAQKFRELSDSIQDKISESLQPDFITKLEKTLPVSKVQKVMVGKSLDEIADQLSKKLLKSEDLKSVIPVLEAGMRNSNIAVQKQVKAIFDQLIKSHVINSNNLKILQPLMIKTFTSSLDYVHTQANAMIQGLMDNDIIHTNNMRLLLPILKAGEKNNSASIRFDTALLVEKLVEDNYILSLSSIKSLLATGINDSDPQVRTKYATIIKKLLDLNFVTKSDIEYFKKLTSHKYIVNLLDGYKKDAPEIIQDKVPVDQLTKLLASLHKDIAQGIGFDESKVSLLQKLFLETKINKLLPLMSQLLPVLAKVMDSNNNDFQKNVINFLQASIAEKLITSENVDQVLSLLLFTMRPYIDENIKFSGITMVKELIVQKLITLKNLNKILPLIEKAMDHSNLFDSFMQMAGLHAINLLCNQKLITTDNLNQFLPLIEKAMIYRPIYGNDNQSLQLLAINTIKRFIDQDLITVLNMNQLVASIEAAMSHDDSSVRLAIIKVVNKLVTKNLITAELADRLRPLVDNQELQEKLRRLQTENISRRSDQIQNLNRQQQQENEEHLQQLRQEDQYQQEHEARLHNVEQRHNRAVEVA